jgi:hypothetical protein
MDVVDFLFDHPPTPKRQCFKTLLPHLVYRTVNISFAFPKIKGVGDLDYASCQTPLSIPRNSFTRPSRGLTII